jgi:Transcription factor involved in chromatin remodeling, contains bromodomain
MSELTRLKDSEWVSLILIFCVRLMSRTSGEDVSYPFIGKPDRNLYRDYYEIQFNIPCPYGAFKREVRGTDSRKKFIPKTTAYPTWQSFEEEVSYVWRNAREYNEDDSDISILAGVLEVSLYCNAFAIRRVRHADIGDLGSLPPTGCGS